MAMVSWDSMGETEVAMHVSWFMAGVLQPGTLVEQLYTGYNWYSGAQYSANKWSV